MNALSLPKDRTQLRLYLVTDEAACLGRDLLGMVLQAVQGGVSCVQLRAKTLPCRDFLFQARQLKTALAPYRIPLIINDRLDIALLAQADGLHVGVNDVVPEEARRWLGEEAWLGLSVESVAQVGQAQKQPVDYLAISPVFSTPTKIDTVEPMGLKGIRQMREQTDKPLVAIGGIDQHNIAQVVAAGADGVAVARAILSASNPKEAAESLIQKADLK